MERRRPGAPRGAAALLLCAVAAAAVPGCGDPPLETGRLGRVELRAPASPVRGLVFLFSGSSGWGAPDDAEATSLAAHGAIVVGVDLPAYRRALDADQGECLYLMSEIESLSQQVQRRFALDGYFSPILAGRGEAGALVAAILAQTPAATVAGAVSVDPTDTVATRLPMCQGAPFEKKPDGFEYGPVASLPGFLSVGFTGRGEAAGRDHARRLAAAGGGTVDHDEGDGKPGNAPPGEVLAGLVQARLAAVVPGANRDLPGSLVEMRAAGASDVLVILLSGDGGWRDLDKTIATYMQAHGTSVVGWDSLRYFWHAKTPERLASDLGEVIRRYTKEWGARDVVLVGFSFGADVLPFAYNRLDDAARGMVRQMSLLALSKQADFEIHVTGWLGAKSAAGAPPVGPELDRVPAPILQCFYGEDDDDSDCPDIASRGVEEVKTPGDHHFDGDYDALARRILDGAARRRATARP